MNSKVIRKFFCALALTLAFAGFASVSLAAAPAPGQEAGFEEFPLGDEQIVEIGRAHV